ncbi:hypothetical protein GCM10007913_11490 [Devosia yakushimensis]|uniref:Uncharacterized protein n=1 Tax=Devosia yakushimensis TaxID=470028 RepID=A0ABQ5UAR9_9HYPH|nr:hypothetical protein [Devosia yakushimensis]GLQ09217.1 hypothetical protein GCM10007913_11490 [Devosia yakushimensis]
MAGTGVYKWYWGHGPFPEHYHGGVATGDEALALAREHFPNGDFCIVEADKTLPSTDCFDAGDILDRFEDKNIECWGENGFDTPITSAEKRELEQKLADCFARWLRKHGLATGHNLNDIRKTDYFAPFTHAEAANG